jgi:hypothetical protein
LVNYIEIENNKFNYNYNLLDDNKDSKLFRNKNTLINRKENYQIDINKIELDVKSLNKNNSKPINFFDLSEFNPKIKIRTLLLLYQITFLGRFFSYIKLSDIDCLIEITNFINLKDITKKLKLIKDLISFEIIKLNNSLKTEEYSLQIFNFNYFIFFEEKNFYSKNFYDLRNYNTPERELIKIYSKTLLNLIDQFDNVEIFYEKIMSENIFRNILEYIYNGIIPQILNNDICDLLEMLFYSKYLVIKSLTTVCNYIKNNIIYFIFLFNRRFNSNYLIR